MSDFDLAPVVGLAVIYLAVTGAFGDLNNTFTDWGQWINDLITPPTAPPPDDDDPPPPPPPNDSTRLNPEPWTRWYYWHNNWVIESHTFPTGSYSTLTASDIGTSHSGLSLAITRQDLKIPLKGKDLWVKFTVAVKGVSNSGNWLRSAIVARIDPLSGEQASLSKYTEYDFYQGSNTNPRTGGNFELWELPFCAADSQFQTYTVHLTPNLVTDWGQTTYDNYMLNYLAPTIEMNNAGMTILVQDVELWEEAPP